jgi:hypothetical protein
MFREGTIYSTPLVDEFDHPGRSFEGLYLSEKVYKIQPGRYFTLKSDQAKGLVSVEIKCKLI